MPDVFVSETKNVKQKTEEKPSNREQKPVISDLKEGTGKALGSFCYYPQNVKFVVKDDTEKIVLFLRKHPITNLKWILITFLMFLAPQILNQFPLLDFMPDNFRFIAVLSWYLIAIAYSFESFLDWYFSVYIITDERVFDVDFLNLVYREISEANIDQIQDVTTKMGGVVRTLFNYGDVFIQTAGEVPNLEFEAVPMPDSVAKVLRGLRVEEEQEKIEGRTR